ncbi:restriction endonuclease subunit S [Zongyangia sp. HA2173]|uniref:restriction endonuclease subunit S n=1 Tax=Zongyangia sp. HA2173 TaxID=3133035 RepID=UPI00315F37F2
MSEITTYEKTKDSGIEWIGRVPSHWRVHTLYQLVTQVKEKNSNLQEKNLLSLSYGKIKRKDIDSPDGLLPASFDGYNIIEDGDIVLRLTDLQNDHTSLRVGLATERGIITSAYTTLRPIDTSNSKYLYYLLHAFDLKKGFYGMGSGVRQGLNYAEVKELRVVLPGQDEQNAIVRFLDNQCGQIDSIIEEAKSSVAEYKKLREAVIFEAVTRGIKHREKTKDSGIKWIGEISESFSITRMRYIVSEYKAGPFGSSLITDKLNNQGNILVYTPEHIATQRTDLENNLYLPEERRKEMAQFFVQPGNIIFPIVGSLGRAMLITDSMPEGIINQRLAKFKLDESKIDTEYFLWMFARSTFYAQFIEVNCRGSFIVNLTKTIVYDMPVILPNTLEEQRQISAYLKRKCGLIDELIKQKQSLVKELADYKKSLIFETVTGKRKVV